MTRGLGDADSCCEPYYAVKLYDGQGQEIQAPRVAPWCSLGLGQCRPDDFVRLRPGERFQAIDRQGTNRLSVWAGDYRPRPDTPYTIRVCYRMTDKAKLVGLSMEEEKRVLDQLFRQAHRCDITSPPVPVRFTEEPVTDEDKKLAAAFEAMNGK
jgi:hypothetical protein